MRVRFGNEARLYYDSANSYASPTWVHISTAQDVTMTLEKTESDATTRGMNGWGADVGALKKFSASFKIVNDDTNESIVTALRLAFINGTPTQFLLLDWGFEDNSQGIRAWCEVMTFTRAENRAEHQTYDVTIKATYAANPPEWYEISDTSSSSSSSTSS